MDRAVPLLERAARGKVWTIVTGRRDLFAPVGTQREHTPRSAGRMSRRKRMITPSQYDRASPWCHQGALPADVLIARASPYRR
jgi:hypothetical protein